MTRAVTRLIVMAALLVVSRVPAQVGQKDEPEPSTEAADPPGEPPPEYYVDPGEAAAVDSVAETPDEPEPTRSEPALAPPSEAPGGVAPVYEPMPPGFVRPVHEPPPPPPPKHLAPERAWWLGARVGWFVPFGDLWGYCVNGTYHRCVEVDTRPWQDFAGAGPLFELDLGARLGRHYNLFALWERAALSNGSAFEDDYGGQRWGNTDFWALGVRVSSNPDEIGLLVEFALGYRRARMRWEDNIELRLTDAPFEARIGLGADVRLSSWVSLSPLATVGVGRFGKAQWVDSQVAGADVLDTFDAFSHGWFTLQVGAHFDLAGRD